MTKVRRRRGDKRRIKKATEREREREDLIRSHRKREESTSALSEEAVTIRLCSVSP